MADKQTGGSTIPRDPVEAGKSLLQNGWASTVDTQTSQQLTGIGLVRQARVNQQQREVAALAAQNGATDPGVVALQASIASQQSLVTVLGVTRDIATTQAPAVPANGWVLQGRVRSKTLAAVAKLSVCLVDETKSWLSAYGYSYTDSTGYFSIPFDPAASGANPPATPLSAYLEVLNKSGKALYIDEAPFTIATGASVYRDVVLSSLTPLGNPPPGATRFQFVERPSPGAPPAAGS
jgi:hypothetical protein